MVVTYYVLRVPEIFGAQLTIMDMNHNKWSRAQKVLGTLGLSIILSGGLIGLVYMQPNPLEWSSHCLPIFLILTFLFFEWMHQD